MSNARPIIKRAAILALAIFTLLMPFIPKQAAAATTAYAPTCSNTDLDKWNWPADLRGEPNANGTTTVELDTSFNSQTSSYVIAQTYAQAADYTTGSHDPHHHNQFTIYYGPNLHMSLDHSGTSADGQAVILNSVNNALTTATLISEPDNDPYYQYNWGGSFGHGVSAVSGNTFSGTPVHLKMASTDVKCIYAAKNVTYDTDFSTLYDKLSDHVDYGNYNTKCSLTDIGCILSKSANAIESAFQAVGMAIVQAVGYMFAPDKDQLNTLFGDFNTWVHNKLGFFLYPLDFITSVFNAFTSSSSWCNDTLCTKNFGNLFGRPFVINLGQTKTTMPTVWIWFTALIRGTTILTLLVAVRQKYKGVTNK